MSIDPGDIQNARDGMPERGKDLSRGYGEIALWRHRKVGQLREEADNANRMDPQGTTYKTEDRYRHASKKSGGQEPEFIGQFLPAVGDLIATLKPSPSSKEAAKEADPAAYYRVMGIEAERRNHEGRLIHAVIRTKPDRSGRW